MTESQETSARTLQVTNRPDRLKSWWSEVYRHLDVLMILAQKDFHTRYKRASLGLTWAVAVPLVQASVMAIVFSHVIKRGGGPGYGIYVMSGIIAYSYFGTVLNTGVMSLVEGSGLTDKVWFPRILLPIVPVLSNMIGILVTTSCLIVIMPLLGATYGVKLLLLVPAVVLLASFVASLSIVLSALNVYYRDVRFLVQAALLVWMYVTPIVYPISALRHLEPLAIANPLTGVVTLFHMATVGSHGPWLGSLIVSIGATSGLLIIGTEAHRRHDRLFVDLL